MIWTVRGFDSEGRSTVCAAVHALVGEVIETKPLVRYVGIVRALITALVLSVKPMRLFDVSAFEFLRESIVVGIELVEIHVFLRTVHRLKIIELKVVITSMFGALLNNTPRRTRSPSIRNVFFKSSGLANGSVGLDAAFVWRSHLLSTRLSFFFLLEYLYDVQAVLFARLTKNAWEQCQYSQIVEGEDGLLPLLFYCEVRSSWLAPILRGLCELDRSRIS